MRVCVRAALLASALGLTTAVAAHAAKTTILHHFANNEGSDGISRGYIRTP